MKFSLCEEKFSLQRKNHFVLNCMLQVIFWFSKVKCWRQKSTLKGEGACKLPSVLFWVKDFLMSCLCSTGYKRAWTWLSYWGQVKRDGLQQRNPNRAGFQGWCSRLWSHVSQPSGHLALVCWGLWKTSWKSRQRSVEEVWRQNVKQKCRKHVRNDARWLDLPQKQSESSFRLRALLGEQQGLQHPDPAGCLCLPSGPLLLAAPQRSTASDALLKESDNCLFIHFNSIMKH